MPRVRRVIPHKSALFVTTSVEEGLVLTANPLVALVLNSCIARATKLWPVRICDFVVEATHIHFLLVVYDPEDLKGFMERFKTESATALNRLMRKERRTLWCKGYDSPVLLDPDKAVEKIVYLYTNPSKDNLVDNIEDFPGLNSWNHFAGGADKSTSKGKFFVRKDFVNLVKENHGVQDYENLASALAHEKRDIFYNLYGIQEWLSCFGISKLEEIQEYRTRIINEVRSKERLHREERRLKSKETIGASQLRATPIGAPYTPRRTGRRSLCLSFSTSLRKAFITEVKSLITIGKEILSLWKKGDLSRQYPQGLYPPCFPKIFYPLHWPGLLSHSG
jgi:REP element-mobilizing transposase RayT